MFLFGSPNRVYQPGFPRIRGDVPNFIFTRCQAPEFSPHTRGCSRTAACLTEFGTAFPAYAGMFLLRTTTTAVRARFPRIRGDVPPAVRAPTAVTTFSPHTRGCSLRGSDMIHVPSVFPAYAGMFRPPIAQPINLLGFPRIRGDVPRS